MGPCLLSTINKEGGIYGGCGCLISGGFPALGRICLIVFKLLIILDGDGSGPGVNAPPGRNKRKDFEILILTRKKNLTCCVFECVCSAHPPFIFSLIWQIVVVLLEVLNLNCRDAKTQQYYCLKRYCKVIIEN
jgi:hypothetical protein